MLTLFTYVAEADLDLTGLPGELAPVVRKCLALRPGDRPTAEELQDSLTTELAEMPTLASPEGWLPRPWTVIIEAYVRQGRELAADPRAAATGPDRPATPQRDAPPPGRPAARPAETAVERTARLPVSPEDDTPQHGDRPTASRSRRERVFVRSVQGLMASALLLLGGGLAYGYYQNRQAEQPGPVDRAFADIRTGDCVRTGLDPDGRWLAPSPETTHCAAPGAHWRVVASTGKGVPDRCGAPYAAVTWTRSSHAATVGLCLERLFHPGECVIGAQPDPSTLTEVTPLRDGTVFATTVQCSDTAPETLAVLRVVKYGLSDMTCPPRTQVRYTFPELGRILCLTTT